MKATTYMFGFVAMLLVLSACQQELSEPIQPNEPVSGLFVVCSESLGGFDPQEYAQNVNGTCVDTCPQGYDAYVTQIGVKVCIEHYGLAEIQEWSVCEQSTDTCQCAKAYETTDEMQIESAEYRCVPEQYAERLLFRGGLDMLDKNGQQSVMIA